MNSYINLVLAEAPFSLFLLCFKVTKLIKTIVTSILPPYKFQIFRHTLGSLSFIVDNAERVIREFVKNKKGVLF